MLLLLHFQRNYHWRWHWNQPSADCRQRVPEAWHRAETHTQRSGWTPPLGRGGLPVLKMAREVKWDNRGPEHWPQRSTFSMAGADFKALVFLISVANIPSSPWTVMYASSFSSVNINTAVETWWLIFSMMFNSFRDKTLFPNGGKLQQAWLDRQADHQGHLWPGHSKDPHPQWRPHVR